MRPLAVALLLTAACYPPPPEHDCETAGGLYVRGAQCDAALDAIQERIELEAFGLGLAPLGFLRGSFVQFRTDPKGYFTDGDRTLLGMTYCSGPLMIVELPAGARWEQTALAHEAMHVAQACFTDWDIYRECMRAENPPYGGCLNAAQHPRWADAIYPAIERVNRGG